MTVGDSGGSEGVLGSENRFRVDLLRRVKACSRELERVSGLREDDTEEGEVPADDELSVLERVKTDNVVDIRAAEVAVVVTSGGGGVNVLIGRCSRRHDEWARCKVTAGDSIV